MNPRRRAILAALIVSGLAATLAAAPKKKLLLGIAPANAPAVDVSHCGQAPTVDAAWFYLGAPPPRHMVAARRALRALDDTFDGVLPRDPVCLHVEVPEDSAALAAINHKLDKRHALPGNVVGFHNRKLGADDTVFANPQPGQGLDIVLLHEVLHAESHRFSAEAGRHRCSKMVEGATEYLTRELAEISLDIPRAEFKTGYGPYLRFYTRLVERLGEDGARQLSTAYLRTGYDAFEALVDQRLGISLRSAARALEADDFRAADQRLFEAADGGR